MPCNGDYMEPSQEEENTRETARHLRYVLTALGKPVPKFVEDATCAGYRGFGQLNPLVVRLCTEIREMPDSVRESLVYDAHSAPARALATWWEKHLDADRIRLKQEAREREEAHRRAALQKLQGRSLEELERLARDCSG